MITFACVEQEVSSCSTLLMSNRKYAVNNHLKQGDKMRKQIILITFMVIISMNIWAQETPACIPVVKSTGNQINHVVVSGNNGSGIFVWQDARSGNYNIYAQRIGNTRYLQWNDHITGKLIAGGASNKINVAAVSDNDGGAIVTWQDDRNSNMDIYAQWIDADGNVKWGWPTTGKLICDDLSEQSAPQMTRDEDGGAYVVWSDNRGGDFDIYIHHIKLDGTLNTTYPNGKRIQLLAEDANQINPAISSDGDHGAIIAYEQYEGALTHDIYAQRIQAGTLANMWDDGGIPACIAAGNQRNPLLVNDYVGSAIIVWEDNRASEANTDIYAQRVADNTIQWTAGGVAITADTLNDIHPVIVSAGEYAAIIVWEHNLSATDTNIYAQRIWGGAAGTSGTLTWNTGLPLLVSTSHDTFQRNPQAVTDGFGGVIIVYESQENLIGRNDIYGQHLNSDGGYSGAGATGGYLICDWGFDKTNPQLCYSTTAVNNAIYAWHDKRNEAAQPGIHDIYTLGLESPEYTFVVSSHDVTNPGGPDLGAEILFNGLPFTTPIYTGYTFGIAGNEPLAAGTYTVEHDDYAGWVPVSVVITDINQNYNTDFLGIRYILNVTSTPSDRSIFRNTLDTGFQTSKTFYSRDIGDVIGLYALETAEYGHIWVPESHTVSETDFNAGNNYTYNIDFQRLYTLPVELSSFTAVLTSDMHVKVAWTSESETNHAGYNVLRSEVKELSTTISVNALMIDQGIANGTQTNYLFTDTEVANQTTYYYWLESVSLAGVSDYYGPLMVLVNAADDDPGLPEIPKVTELFSAFPNPFNPSTNMRYSMRRAGDVRIDVFNLKGQILYTYTNSHTQPGYYQASWDGRDSTGNLASTGVYFYRMTSDNYTSTKKMVLAK